MWPFKVERVPATPAEEKLDQIRNLLFPHPKLEEGVQDGESFKYQIDYSIDSNLYSVLSDLMDGNNDEVCHKTINSCLDTLDKVRKILEAYMEINDDAKYIIVDTLNDRPSVDEVE